MHRFDKTRLIKWTFIRIIFPLFPILVHYIMSFILRINSIDTQIEKVIVFLFLLPIIYLNEFEDSNAKHGLYFLSSVCIIIYCCYIVVVNGDPLKLNDNLSRIYFTIKLLAAIEIGSALIYEIYRSFIPYDNEKNKC